MLFIFFVLPFFLVNAELDSAVEAAFKQLNKKYNPKIKWSTELEQRALEYLKSPNSVKVDMVIKGKKNYPKNNPSHIGVKLYAAFRDTIRAKKDEVTALNEASQYGCNIILNNGLKKREILRYACLYDKN
ncbi:hypothetical protein V3C99_016240 [Haemonchus contortus]